VPAVLRDSSLNTPDVDVFSGPMVPGAPAADAPLRIDGKEGWFLNRLGPDFTLLVFGDAPRNAQGGAPVPVLTIGAGMDAEGLLAQRFDARPGTVYLLRPDQHVCARWRRYDPAAVQAALNRAMGKS